MRAFMVVVKEALIVAVVALTLALAANAVSPRGLRLDRNYFPKGETSLAATVDAPTKPADAVLHRLARHQLRAIAASEAVAWFRDPQREQGLVVFVDARDDALYEAGHIPGAWPFNHYRPERYLPTVLPACLTALKVVVYCTGGQCEDSEFAAILLRNAGVSAENLFIYPGGITEWKARHQPVEIGGRNSGRMLPPAP